MKKRAVKYWIMGCLFLSACSLAQPQFQAGGNFSLAYPQREFKDNIKNTGIGGAGHFAYRFGQSPFLVGAALGFWIYGSETNEVPMIQDVPVMVDVTTTNSIISGHLLFRIQPQSGMLQPYIDGLFGFHYLNTTTDISSQNSWHDDDDEIASSTNFDDAALSYGFGGGLMISVYDAVARGREGNLQAVAVDMGVRYIQGGEAEYLKEGDIQKNPNRPSPSRSKTDLTTFHVGVSFDFTIGHQISDE
jgi:hypothetical protein